VSGPYCRYQPPVGSTRTTPTTDVQVGLTSFFGSSKSLNVSRYLVGGGAGVDTTWRVVSVPLADLLAGTGWTASNLEQVNVNIGLADTVLVDAIQVWCPVRQCLNRVNGTGMLSAGRRWEGCRWEGRAIQRTLFAHLRIHFCVAPTQMLSYL
jgi:hypothetical protein